MFLLVSICHVGAHPDEHQHGVSIQISINLGKTFLRISRIRNIPLTWILARVFAYLPPFISRILDFIYWTVLIFILIYFEWRDTENQQYIKLRFPCDQRHILTQDFLIIKYPTRLPLKGSLFDSNRLSVCLSVNLGAFLVDNFFPLAAGQC